MVTAPGKERARCIGGSLFLYDRGKIRSFRRDGHEWKKKSDGRTVKETHEKLKARFGLYLSHRTILANGLFTKLSGDIQ